MGPQNLNNYYFNKLDARLDYSSYHDFFLAADERNYNEEVIYSPYIICVWDHLDDYLNGIPFPSNCLGFWIDLASTGSTWQPNLHCNEYYENNTLLSLCYWEGGSPTLGDAKCSCPKCENRAYTANTNFVESVCDVGLTGIDNSLVKYMSGNTTEFDWCKKEFILLSAFTGTVTGQTLPFSGSCTFSGITWSSNTPLEIINESGSTLHYPCFSNGDLNTSGTSLSDNFNIVQNNLLVAGCCLFTGGSAYELTISNGEILVSGTSTGTGIFSAKTSIGLGYISVPCQVESLKLWVHMPDTYKYDHLNYDRRFKMKQITGYTEHRTNYSIVSVTGGTEGYYQQLYGGFYQGFYELDEYPYKVLPNRTECGWTVETLLKIRTGDTKCDNTLITCNIPMTMSAATGVVTVMYPNHGKEVGDIVSVSDSTDSLFNTDLTPPGETFAIITSVPTTGEFTYSSGKLAPASPLQRTNLGCVTLYEKEIYSGTSLTQIPIGQVNVLQSPKPRDTIFSVGNVDLGFSPILHLDQYGLPWNQWYGLISHPTYSGFTYKTSDFLFDATGTTDITLYSPQLQQTLNDVYPNNAGFFYYWGTRAENKFHNAYSGESGLNTCDQTDYSCYGEKIHLMSSATTWTGCPPQPDTVLDIYDSTLDVFSNSFGLRLTPWDDFGQTGYTVCYRAIYYTGACITTYTSKTITDCHNNVVTTKKECVTGLTYMSGWTVVEKCSPTVCGLSGETYRSQEPWLLVSARFRRNFCYEGCDILNMGGFNDLVYIPVLNTPGYIDSGVGNATVSLVREAPLMPGFDDQGNKVAVTGYYDGPKIGPESCGTPMCPPATGCTSNYTKLTEKLRFSKLWSDEKYLRMGTLTIFINGRPVLIDDQFEEIIPRRLNTKPQKQVGVPYNISWGGGSQGLYENLTFRNLSGGTIERCSPYVQDPTDLGLLIEKYFAGTYDGGISQIRQYLRPLGNDEIFHNFLVNKDRYDLLDCVKGKCGGCYPCPAIYILDCQSLDVALNYIDGMTTVSVDSLGEYITDPPYIGVKFTSALVENVNSYTITKRCCGGTGPPEVVTIPFKALPDDVLTVDIVKLCPKDSKVTLMGNLYK